MLPRTSWKGFLQLSLISVPVKAFTANNPAEEIHLNQLHKDCNSRVRYQKVCPEHGELSQEQIVKGYEYQKDRYVVVDPDELDKLRTKTDHSVSISGFVAQDAVDPLFLAGKAHYLLPDGVAGERPYALLHRGMVDNGVCAIAQVVMSGREQLVMVRPMGRLLVLTGLNYLKQVKPADEFDAELATIEPAAEELQLTNTLIGATKIDDFDMGRFEDRYVEKLRKLIQIKIDGQEVVQAPDHEEPRILNLMDALKQSVAAAQAQGAGAEPEAGGKKMAPSAGTGAGKRKARSRTESG